MRHHLPRIKEPAAVPAHLSELDRKFLEKHAPAHDAVPKKELIKHSVKERFKKFLFKPEKKDLPHPIERKGAPEEKPVRKGLLKASVKDRFKSFLFKREKPKPAAQEHAAEKKAVAPDTVAPARDLVKASVKERFRRFLFRPEKKAENAAERKPHEVPVAKTGSEEIPTAAVAKEPAKAERKLDTKTPQPVKDVKKWNPFARKKPLTTEERAEQVAKSMRLRQPKRKRLQRKSLQEYLDKAGYEADAAALQRTVFRAIVAVFLVLTLGILAAAALWGTHTTLGGLLGLLLFVLALWTVVFLAALILAMGTIYFFLDYRIYRRTQQIEDVLPDFLQLTSANIAAGMPIDRALWYSIRPSFGVLAKEMEVVAKATVAGEDLEQSLLRFTERYDSTLLKRSIGILLEGLRSGGELADLLNKIALNIDELKIMRKEMAANVTTYAIFILVAAVGIAPVLFGLATQLLQVIVKITGSLDLSSTSSLFSLGAVSPDMVGNFVMFSYFMLVTSSIFGACIVSVIQKGNVLNGIKTIPVYAAIAIIVYKLSVYALGGVFGSIV